MTKLNVIVFFLLLNNICCKQEVKVITKENEQKDFLIAANKFNTIIFGIFCGECGSHCATMFKYSLEGNNPQLFVDSSDSYFNNKGNIICSVSIRDKRKIQSVDSLAGTIPEGFLTTYKPKQIFGCPDCSDGCGIYLEIKQAGRVKKFYIDTDTGKLSDSIKVFAEMVNRTLSKL